MTSELEWVLRRHLEWADLPAPETEYRFAPPRRWRFDFAWPDLRLAVELDGGTHTGGRHVRAAGYEADCDKLNAAALAGWLVLRFTARQVHEGLAVQTIERALDQLMLTAGLRRAHEIGTVADLRQAKQTEGES